jgi:Ran GTPase-activating protein (RanGAP) involved in mRNA processing and transport
VYNTTLNHLNLAQNNLGNQGAKALASALREKSCRLKFLDVSSNNIEDIGATMLAQAIEKNERLETLLLKDNRLYDHAGASITSALKINQSIVKLGLEKNFMKHKFILEIEAVCKRNKLLNSKKEMMPDYKEEISELMKKRDPKSQKYYD